MPPAALVRLLETLMRSRLVEVGHVRLEYPTKVLFTADEHVIEAFATDAAHQSLADRVRTRGLDRVPCEKSV